MQAIGAPDVESAEASGRNTMKQSSFPFPRRRFSRNHLASAASMDFFTVPTLMGRLLFVVILLSQVRRRIVHFNITEHPTAEWTAQQVVDAFPDDTAPKWLDRDRDSIYDVTFKRVSTLILHMDRALRGMSVVARPTGPDHATRSLPDFEERSPTWPPPRADDLALQIVV
jgi:hypothetical protein